MPGGQPYAHFVLILPKCLPFSSELTKLGVRAPQKVKFEWTFAMYRCENLAIVIWHNVGVGGVGA